MKIFAFTPLLPLIAGRPKPQFGNEVMVEDSGEVPSLSNQGVTEDGAGFGDGMFFGQPTPMSWPGADKKPFRDPPTIFSNEENNTSFKQKHIDNINNKRQKAYLKDKQKYENDDKKIALAKSKMQNSIYKAEIKVERVADKNTKFAAKHQLKQENNQKAELKKQNKKIVKENKSEENFMNNLKNILRHCTKNKLDDKQENFSLEDFEGFPDCYEILSSLNEETLAKLFQTPE